jgi:hypothetical protein
MPRLRHRLIACLLAVAIPASAANSTSTTDTWTVRPDGIGPIQIGMSLSELDSTLHTSFSKPSDPEQSCTYVKVPDHPGIRIMLLDGHVARIDIDNATTRTTKGIHNGDSETHVQQVYQKKLAVMPHKYEPAGHYLTEHTPDGKYGIRFETKDGKIIRYYAGEASAIELVEGCG